VNQKNAETAENPEAADTTETTETEEKSEVAQNTEATYTEEGTDKESEAEPEVEFVEKSALEEQQKKADENYQRLLRAQADLDNFRRRTRLEKEEAAKYASLGIIEQLLPVVDNFERAIASSQNNPDLDSLIKGVEMIFRQISETLEQAGLKSIDAVGEPFNPDFHQAIMQVESEEHEEGIVVEEVQKGYLLKEKVIRAAMVKVSK
jgi:molecular chaperone GrpE